jgi:hypothetical protein
MTVVNQRNCPLEKKQRRLKMAKPKPSIHIELSDDQGNVIGGSDEFALSESQLNWLAAFFAPIVEKTIQEKETRQ